METTNEVTSEDVELIKEAYQHLFDNVSVERLTDSSVPGVMVEVSQDASSRGERMDFSPGTYMTLRNGSNYSEEPELFISSECIRFELYKE